MLSLFSEERKTKLGKVSAAGTLSFNLAPKYSGLFVGGKSIILLDKLTDAFSIVLRLKNGRAGKFYD